MLIPLEDKYGLKVDQHQLDGVKYCNYTSVVYDEAETKPYPKGNYSNPRIGFMTDDWSFKNIDVAWTAILARKNQYEARGNFDELMNLEVAGITYLITNQLKMLQGLEVYGNKELPQNEPTFPSLPSSE